MEKAIINGIRGYLAALSQETLGDRSLYVGSSDVSGCLRKSYFNKISPQEHEDKTLVHFVRGHIAEDIVAFAMENQGYKFTRQYDASHPDFPYLKAHIDFLFGNPENGRVSILECKSSGQVPPDSPYTGWTRQLAYQMALVSSMFPGIDVRGRVLCIDVTTGNLKVYPVMDMTSKPLMDDMLDRGKTLYQALAGDIPVEMLDVEPGPMCGFCGHRDSCPAMSVDGDGILDLSGILSELERFQDLKAKIEDLKQEQERLRQTILDFMAASTYGKANGFIVEKKVSTCSRFDTTRFKGQYPNLYDEFVVPSEQVKLFIKKTDS